MASSVHDTTAAIRLGRTSFPATAMLLAGTVVSAILTACTAPASRTVPATTFRNTPEGYLSRPYLIGARGASNDSICGAVLREFDLIDVTEEVLGVGGPPCRVLRKRDGSMFEPFGDSVLEGLRLRGNIGLAGPIYRIGSGDDRESRPGRLALFQPVLQVTFRPGTDTSTIERILREVNAKHVVPNGVNHDIPFRYEPICGTISHCMYYTVMFDLSVGEGINQIAHDLMLREEVAFVNTTIWFDLRGVDHNMED